MWSAVIERGHKHARPNGLAYHVYVFNDGHLKYQSYDVQNYFIILTHFISYIQQFLSYFESLVNKITYDFR